MAASADGRRHRDRPRGRRRCVGPRRRPIRPARPGRRGGPRRGPRRRRPGPPGPIAVASHLPGARGPGRRGADGRAGCSGSAIKAATSSRPPDGRTDRRRAASARASIRPARRASGAGGVERGIEDPAEVVRPAEAADQGQGLRLELRRASRRCGSGSSAAGSPPASRPPAARTPAGAARRGPTRGEVTARHPERGRLAGREVEGVVQFRCRAASISARKATSAASGPGTRATARIASSRTRGCSSTTSGASVSSGSDSRSRQAPATRAAAAAGVGIVGGERRTFGEQVRLGVGRAPGAARGPRGGGGWPRDRSRRGRRVQAARAGSTASAPALLERAAGLLAGPAFGGLQGVEQGGRRRRRRASGGRRAGGPWR